MQKRIWKRFGLRDEDELTGIVVVMLAVILGIFALGRGCAAVQDIEVDQISAEITSHGNLLRANTPIVPIGFEGGEVTFTGSYAPNTDVDLYLNGDFIGTTRTNGLGDWSYSHLVTEENQYDLELHARDNAGEKIVSRQYPFSVIAAGALGAQGLRNTDDLEPTPTLAATAGAVSAETAAPAVRLVAPTIDSGLNGTTIDAGKFVLAGTGAAGASVLLTANDKTLGRVRADDNGNWSLNASFNEPGSYRVLATAADDDSFQSNAITVNVNESAAAEVSAPEAAEEVAVAAPTLRLARDLSTPDTYALVGSGEPNTVLTILRNGEPIGEADVDADGAWEFMAEREGLPEAIYLALATDDAGSVAAQSSPTIIRVSQVAAAEAEAEPEAEPEEPESEEATAETVEEAEPVEALVNIDDVTFDAGALTVNDEGVLNGPIALSGSGAPAGSRVIVYLSGEPIGEALIGEDGSWTLETDVNLIAGEASLQAVIVADDEVISAESQLEMIDVPEQRSTLAVVFGSGADAGSAEDGADGDGSSGADGAAGAGSAQPVIELIVDSSYSMTFPPNSSKPEDRLLPSDPDSRIAIVRGTLSEIVDTLPDGLPLAMRVFGNRLGNYECQTTLEIPPSPLDRESTKAFIRGIVPIWNANTAIADSLRAVADDLAGVTGSKTIVLLTDGAETCDGDPAAEIQALRDAGIDVTVSVVGFAIADDTLKAQFEEWAEIGGGVYYDTGDREQLKAALSQVLRATYRVIDADGETVTLGVIGGEPIDLPVGKYTVEIGSASYDVVVGKDATELVIE